jgi:hypothetical protein
MPFMPWVDIMRWDDEKRRFDCPPDSFNHVSSKKELKDMAFSDAVANNWLGPDDRLQVKFLVWPPLNIRQAWGWSW